MRRKKICDAIEFAMRLSFCILKQKIVNFNCSKMRSKGSEELAKRICHYYEKVCGGDRKMTYSHFISEGISKVTICRVLNRFGATGTAEYKKSVGRPARVATPKVIKKVGKLYQKDPGVSERFVTQALTLAKTTVHRIKAVKLGLRSYRATPAPKYTQ